MLKKPTKKRVKKIEGIPEKVNITEKVNIELIEKSKKIDELEKTIRFLKEKISTLESPAYSRKDAENYKKNYQGVKDDDDISYQKDLKIIKLIFEEKINNFEINLSIIMEHQNKVIETLEKKVEIQNKVIFEEISLLKNSITQK